MLEFLPNTYRRYVDVALVLIRDVLSHFGQRATTIVTARLVGVGFFVMTLAVVTGYARALEHGQTLHLFGWTVEPRESIVLLVLVGIASLVFMSSAAALTYLSNRWALFLRSDYTLLCSKRVILIANEARRIWVPSDFTQKPDQFLRNLARQASIRCGRVAAQLVSKVVPSVLVIVVAVPALFYINALLTTVVLPLLGISMGIHYRVNVRAAHQRVERDHYSKRVGDVFKQMLRQGAEQPAPDTTDELLQRFHDESVKDYVNTESRYRLASHTSQLLSNISIAMMVVVILVVLGGTILIEGTGWSVLLVYLLAIRYTMGQAKHLLATIADCNRFYFQVHQYFQFLKNSQARLPRPHEGAPEQLRLRIGQKSPPLSSSQAEVTIVPGQRVTVLTSQTLNRFSLPALFSSLLRKSESGTAVDSLLAHTAVITKRSPLSGGSTLRAALRLPPGQGVDVLRPTLEACGLWDKLAENLTADADGLLDGPVPGDLDDTLRLALLLSSVAARGFRVVAIDIVALWKIDADCRDPLLDQFRSAIVLVVIDDVARIGKFDEDWVAVVGESGGLAGIGDLNWALSHQEELALMFSSAYAGKHAFARENSGSDEVDDDDE